MTPEENKLNDLPAEKIVDVGEEQESSYGSPLFDERPGGVISELLRKNRCGFYGGNY